MRVIRIICLADGTPTPFDGQYLKEYDPSRDGVDPSGRPMLAHVTTTPEPSRAHHFGDLKEVMECWKRVDPRKPLRPDGQPNRPLTAFSITVEMVEPASVN